MRPIQIKRNKAALDRAEELRNQPELLEKFWDQAKIIHLSNQKFLVNEAGSLKYLSSREDRKSTRLNSSHSQQSRMPSSA